MKECHVGQTVHNTVLNKEKKECVREKRRRGRNKSKLKREKKILRKKWEPEKKRGRETENL